MSETAATSAPRPLRPETVVIALVCAIVLAAGWYVMSQRQQALRSSPAGLDGLQVWLTSKGVSAQNFAGGWLMDQTSIGLLVLPVYDTALDEERERPTTKEELLLQQDEYDLNFPTVADKALRVPTLVVLPKWRSGMRLTGLAHPILNVEQERLQATLRKVTGDRTAAPVLAETAFTDLSYRSSDGQDLRATIYAAQMFASDACTPIIGREDAMLLADCSLGVSDKGSGGRVLVLSDPDLLNNHGLRLGDNATIALDFIRSRAEDRNVVIDYSRSTWLRNPETDPVRERTWADLARFFGPPFLTLWLGAALTLALFLWRAALRYGPALPDLAAPGASKLLAVRARARLMRLSGQDGALVHDYAAARIAATAAALFGPAHARHYAGEGAFLNYTERRHPAEAPRLRGVLGRIRQLPARLPAAAAIQLIDELEQVLENIINDA
ncbi:hypothetical protein [Roseibium salinum]|uniref:DUF4350 domain-containing protein n=1 Tax=Roseibium salinum TaxID=1604349 RepID=A0ABT3R6X1_9HYPH|nr:hypothetical protein [Roseibium sp. DSM 29163]MCX2725046.1 hypothetical protein [Roseibium sp. DSM 29163]